MTIVGEISPRPSNGRGLFQSHFYSARMARRFI
jgi:hypothetical protein